MYSQTTFRNLKLYTLVLVIGAFISSCGNVSERSPKGKDAKTSIINILKEREEISLQSKKEQIEKIIDQKIASGFNGNILIAQKDQIVFEKSSGFANFEKSIPNRSNSRFQLASLSKTFTAVAVMQLVERGKLSLDLTVKDYYPNFPYAGVTIRSLLSHRTGLPHYEYTFDVLVRKEKLYPSNQEIMQWFATASPVPSINNKPDHFFSYNNTNFAILAAIVEQVSGMNFSQYLHANIFDPLGMRNTLLANELSDSTRANNLTYGYQGNRKIEKDYFDDVLGDKGVYSTSHDLLKWYKGLKTEEILSNESLREVFTPRSFEFPGLRNYGYGFRLWLNDKQQTDYIYHTGWWKGYNTIMFFDLREDFVIIVLSNRYNKSVYQIKDIIDVLHAGKRNSTMEESILDQ